MSFIPYSALETASAQSQQQMLEQAPMRFGFMQAGGDLRIRNSTINGVTYTLVTRKNAAGSRTIVEFGVV